jgi:hypothetical protein
MSSSRKLFFEDVFLKFNSFLLIFLAAALLFPAIFVPLSTLVYITTLLPTIISLINHLFYACTLD